ncbi:MAG: hypothetical protein ACK4MV_16445 [Beijerinckiaceae bacterium]
MADPRGAMAITAAALSTPIPWLRRQPWDEFLDWFVHASQIRNR